MMPFLLSGRGDLALRKTLWIKIIKSKYKLEESNLVPKIKIQRKVSTIWIDIMPLKDKNSHMHSLYMQNIRIRVGEGCSTLFWNDNWLGNPCLAKAYPSLFRIVNAKDELLSQVWARRTDESHWDLNFRRRLFDCEIHLVNELYQIFDQFGVMVNNEASDSFLWGGCRSQKVSVKFMYDLVNPQAIIADTTYDLIWRNVAPYRVRCFAWLVHLGRIKTAQYLLN